MEAATQAGPKVLTKRGRGRKRRNNRIKQRNAGVDTTNEPNDVAGLTIDCDSARYVYLIIGSKDSTDLDTLYLFDHLPPTQACYRFCDFAALAAADTTGERGSEELELQRDSSLSHLQRQRLLKPENKNIIVLDSEGIVCASFKGIPDAIHNCVYHTYALHEQDHPSPLAHRLVHRNVPLRLVKATRDLMGIVSKTRYRQHSKAAFKAANSFAARKECLLQVDFREIKDELNASQLKTVAFHFSQLIGLMRGREYFTKADLAAAFPDLAPFLHRADDATSHLEVLNKYRDIFVGMIDNGLQVHAKGSLLLFTADTTPMCGDDSHRRSWNMLTYQSRGAIVDCVRERCVAYPLDHFFAISDGGGESDVTTTPSWPTDEDLLRREGLEQFACGRDDSRPRQLEFYTAFLDAATCRPRIAGERSFDVPPSVMQRWQSLLGGLGEEGTRLLHDAMNLYTLILAAQPAEDGGDRNDDDGDGDTEAELSEPSRCSSSSPSERLMLFGLRHHHTWDMQPMALVQRLAAQVGLPAFTLPLGS